MAQACCSCWVEADPARLMGWILGCHLVALGPGAVEGNSGRGTPSAGSSGAASGTNGPGAFVIQGSPGVPCPPQPQVMFLPLQLLTWSPEPAQ